MNLESNSQFVDELRDALFRNVKALCQLAAEMETLKSHGAEALDQALDDAMAEELENRDE